VTSGRPPGPPVNLRTLGRLRQAGPDPARHPTRSIAGGDAIDLSSAPPLFTAAVAALTAVRPRPEVVLTAIRPPQRLAPWTYALGAEVLADDLEVAEGRLVLLHDPDGQDAWDGVLRLVAYLRAEVDDELIIDPLLTEVGWSWLTEALELAGARWRALGGTVTRTSSTRFGDIAGPARTHAVELRASWTAVDAALTPHGDAFCALLATAAGLPPTGATRFGQRDS
jgi:hypothetical protein